MSGEVVNLRMARKRKTRSEQEAQAAENRVAFGLAKTEKTVATAEKARAERIHRAHRRQAEDEPRR